MVYMEAIMALDLPMLALMPATTVRDSYAMVRFLSWRIAALLLATIHELTPYSIERVVGVAALMLDDPKASVHSGAYAIYLQRDHPETTTSVEVSALLAVQNKATSIERILIHLVIYMVAVCRARQMPLGAIERVVRNTPYSRALLTQLKRIYK